MWLTPTALPRLAPPCAAHKQFETGELRIIVEVKACASGDQYCKEHIDAGLVVFDSQRWLRAAKALPTQCDQILKMNFMGTVGSIPGALFAEKLIEDASA
jgi:taurine-pyruvate aminotransferase